MKLHHQTNPTLRIQTRQGDERHKNPIKELMSKAPLPVPHPPCLLLLFPGGFTFGPQNSSLEIVKHAQISNETKRKKETQKRRHATSLLLPTEMHQNGKISLYKQRSIDHQHISTTIPIHPY